MFEEVVQRLSGKFGYAHISDYLARLIPKLIVSLLIFFAFWALWKLVSNIIERLLKRFEVDRTLSTFFRTVTKYAILAVGAITALGELGIDTTSLLTSLGVAGLTIGFAARDTLANVISGIFIFWDRPFVLGDLVEVQGLYGRVDSITLRSTRVVTVDGKMLAIPNSVVANGTVVSYTNFPNLRLDIEITLGVGQDLSVTREIFLDLIKGDPRFMDTPKPHMVVTAINDFNVTARFSVWLDDEKTHIPVRFELRERLFEAFRTANVDMPFETLDLRIVHDERTQAQSSR